MEARDYAKPLIEYHGFPAYYQHYRFMADKVEYPLHNTIYIKYLCNDNEINEALKEIKTIRSIILAEAKTLSKTNPEYWLTRPSLKKAEELLQDKVLWDRLYDYEEEEEPFESELWDEEEEEEDPDPWEEEEDEDWEVEEWDIPEEDEVLAWWCEDPECKTVIVCTKHSIDCHPEDDP
jgi:hypothetical protein